MSEDPIPGSVSIRGVAVRVDGDEVPVDDEE
jgi:hypothetical protein